MYVMYYISTCIYVMYSNCIYTCTCTCTQMYVIYSMDMSNYTHVCYVLH